MSDVIELAEAEYYWVERPGYDGVTAAQAYRSDGEWLFTSIDWHNSLLASRCKVISHIARPAGAKASWPKS